MLACELNKAFCHLKLKQWRDAIKSCDEALKLDSHEAKAFFRKAVALRMLGQDADAKKCILQAKRLDPNDPGIDRELTLVEWQWDQRKKREKKVFGLLFDEAALAAAEAAVDRGGADLTERPGDALVVGDDAPLRRPPLFREDKERLQREPARDVALPGEDDELESKWGGGAAVGALPRGDLSTLQLPPPDSQSEDGEAMPPLEALDRRAPVNRPAAQTVLAAPVDDSSHRAPQQVKPASQQTLPVPPTAAKSSPTTPSTPAATLPPSASSTPAVVSSSASSKAPPPLGAFRFAAGAASSSSALPPMEADTSDDDDDDHDHGNTQVAPAPFQVPKLPASASASLVAAPEYVYDNAVTNAANPKVFLNFAIDGEPAGKVIVELFMDRVPKSAENFRKLCTGEKGKSPLLPKVPLHLKETRVHRIVPDFLIQGGDLVRGDGTGPVLSCYGGGFEHERLDIPLDCEGLLCMASEGPGTATVGSQFFFTLVDCSHLNGTCVVIGKVIEGIEVLLDDLPEVPTDANDAPTRLVTIRNCGEWDLF